MLPPGRGDAFERYPGGTVPQAGAMWPPGGAGAVPQSGIAPTPNAFAHPPCDWVDALARQRLGMTVPEGRPPVLAVPMLPAHPTPGSAFAVAALHGLDGQVLSFFGATLGQGGTGQVRPGSVWPRQAVMAVKVEAWSKTTWPHVLNEVQGGASAYSPAAVTEVWYTPEAAYLLMPLMYNDMPRLSLTLVSQTERDVVTLCLLRDILPQLGALHLAGRAHGDLKLENLLYRNGRFALADFNLNTAALLPQPERLVGGWRVPNTTTFLTPPECFFGTGGSLCDMDVFDLGLCAFDLAAGPHAVQRGAGSDVDMVDLAFASACALRQLPTLAHSFASGDADVIRLWASPGRTIGGPVLYVLDHLLHHRADGRSPTAAWTALESAAQAYGLQRPTMSPEFPGVAVMVPHALMSGLTSFF